MRLSQFLPSHARPAAAPPGAQESNGNRKKISKAVAVITGAALAAAVAATAGGTGLAAASARPAISGTEHFQIMATSATARRSSTIATGAFTAGGVSEGGTGNSGTSTLVFPGGRLKIKHHTVRSKGAFNPRTCLFIVRGSGTYQLGGGTGKYARVSGSGRFALHIWAVESRNSHGHCTQALPPAVYQQVITLHGPVRS